MNTTSPPVQPYQHRTTGHTINHPAGHSTSRPGPAVRGMLLFTLSFLALPIGGYLTMVTIGPIDSAAAALAGGAITGLILGAAQSLTSRGRLGILRWTGATTVGLALGAALGSAAVDYATTLPALALMGLLTGTVLGIAQALALPAPATGHPRTGTHRRWPWIAITAALWTLGWTITTLAGINVDEQFVVFGASGAIVYATLSGVALQLLSPASKSTPTSDQGARK